MCGVAGVWHRSGSGAPDLGGIARAMARAMERRGPDGEGVWVDTAHGVALGHRRLAIVDLSREGSQPMVSACGRRVIAFNGEVYNHPELRTILEAAGHVFRGGSDTEVVLAAIGAWGIEAALERFVGMFAIAIWDRREGILTLVRDRLGIKPLYWGVSGGSLLFASELKAFAAYPGFRGEPDPDSIALLLRHGYVPDPHCIYRDVRKLAPGTLVRFRRPEQPESRTWWSARDVAQAGLDNPLRAGDRVISEELESLLRLSVRQRMIADVPVGAFLSGGVDSSTVVAMMQAQSTRPVRTFSMGFPERDYDEAPWAARVAAHLGTDHAEFYVSSAQAQAVVPELGIHWDEPFADSSQIPTLLLSRLARERVKVVLSGDGGDELFGGYGRYRWTARIARVLAWCSPAVRACLARALRGSSAGPPPAGRRFADRIRKLSALLAYRDDQILYRSVVSHWQKPELLVHGARDQEGHFADGSLREDIPGLVPRMMYLDTRTYLPGDILTKLDRASMACGLEARVPLLDHRVFEFAWRIPMAQRIGRGPGKRALRAVLARHVPRELFERPKRGFGVPLAQWLRGPLRDWAEYLLGERAIRDEGILDPRPIRRAWSEHLSGTARWHYLLWNVLVFRAWHAARPVVRREMALAR